MSILQSFLSIVGSGAPSPAVAAPSRFQRKRNPNLAQSQQATMRNPNFYQTEEPQFVNPPVTGDIIREQLERIRQRSAPPKLDPISRVRPVNMELASPDNFQNYYRQLQSINSIGREQLATAQAKAAFARLQQMQQSAAGAMPFQGNVGGRVGAAAVGGGSLGRAGSGLGGGGGIPTNPRENFKYAQQLAGQFGWNNPSELAAWYTLGMKESGWRNTAQNPTSTAFGIGQFLNSTWAGVGIAKTSDPYLQVLAMARYIRNRYGSPSRALAFHRAKNWY